ncbi:hypothetical protein ACFL23_03130 [Patescibacteria group bacterium]
MDNLILKLYKTPKTVFTTKDIALVWGIEDIDNLKSKIAYYVKRGNLTRLRRGIFIKDKKYNLKELAASIYIPAYVSFETVLREEGVLFQHHKAIFVASYLSREIKCDNRKIIYRKLKEQVLLNNSGIIVNENFSIASRERAFMDMIYLFKSYHFDNLSEIDWDKCFDLSNIYNNVEMKKRLNKYYKYAKQDTT